MKIANYGDPFVKRVTLRLTEKQMTWLGNVSTIMGISPSDYLRMVINTAMISTTKSVDTMLKGTVGMPVEERIGGNDEFVKTDGNNLV